MATVSIVEQHSLWDTLSTFVEQNDGEVMSGPRFGSMRVECLHGSNLLTQLAAAGYAASLLGSVSRISPRGMTLVDTIEVALP